MRLKSKFPTFLIKVLAENEDVPHNLKLPIEDLSQGEPQRQDIKSFFFHS